MKEITSQQYKVSLMLVSNLQDLFESIERVLAIVDVFLFVPKMVV